MCYGSVQHIAVLELVLSRSFKSYIEDDYEDFESLKNVEKSSYVLGSELWESKFDGFLSLFEEYIVDVWEMRKHNMIVTQDPIYNSILSLHHLDRGMLGWSE